MLTPHQLSKPSGNVALDDPALLATLRAEADRVLGEDSTDEITDATLLAMAESACGWGPHTTGAELRDSIGRQVSLMMRMRPPMAHADGKSHEYAEESSSPHQFDTVGKARIHGKGPELKALRLKIKADHENELAVARGDKKPEPAQPLNQ